MRRRSVVLVLALALALPSTAAARGARSASPPQLRLAALSPRARLMHLDGRRLAPPSIERLREEQTKRAVPVLTPRGAPPPREVTLVQTDYEMRSARVRHTMFRFLPNEPALSFAVVTGEEAYSLELARSRDRLRLFREPGREGLGIAFGMAMFSAATLFAARAPHPLRVLLDGPGHFGPALFDSGGVGAGVRIQFD